MERKEEQKQSYMSKKLEQERVKYANTHEHPYSSAAADLTFLRDQIFQKLLKEQKKRQQDILEMEQL